MTQKVLIADDSIASQRLFEMVLTREGYDVITVSSGPEVMPAIEEKQPDLALTGINNFFILECDCRPAGLW